MLIVVKRVERVAWRQSLIGPASDLRKKGTN